MTSLESSLVCKDEWISPWFWSFPDIFIALACSMRLSFAMKLKRGEELETGVPWFWLALSLTQREKLFNEQTMYNIILIESRRYVSQSCNLHVMVGLAQPSAIHMSY